MAELTITIGNKNYSSWSLRGWLALKQTGAAFDEVVVPLDRPDTKERLLAAGPSGSLAAPVVDVAELLQPVVALPAVSNDRCARLDMVCHKGV